MAKQKFPKIYILNSPGGHGHFLQYILDKFYTLTPDIKDLPFDDHGRSHLKYNQSGQFIFIDDLDIEDFLLKNSNKNCILLTIDNELLYFERICLSRADEKHKTDLYSEQSISDFLIKWNSTFPKYCQEKNITLKKGYEYGFRFLNENGVIKRDIKRKTCKDIKNNNVIFFPIKNFFTIENLKEGLLNLSKFFNINLNIDKLPGLYNEFYSKNEILQSHYNVYEYINGNKSIKLDILQQAYVDSQR